MVERAKSPVKRARSTSKSRKATPSRSPTKSKASKGIATSTPPNKGRGRSRSASITRRATKAVAKSPVRTTVAAADDRSRYVPLMLFLGALAALIWFKPSMDDFKKYVSESEPAIDAWLKWLREYRLQGMLLLGTIEILAVALCIPPVAFAIELVAGSIFDFVPGIALVSVAKCTAASVTFLMGRYFLRSRVESWAKASPKFAALHQEATSEGWKVVVAMRVSPAPAFVANYGLALTSISFQTYIVATFFATLAPITQNCLIGSSTTDIMSQVLGRSSASVDSAFLYWAKKALLAVGVLSGVWVSGRMLRVMSTGGAKTSQAVSKGRGRKVKVE